MDPAHRYSHFSLYLLQELNTDQAVIREYSRLNRHLERKAGKGVVGMQTPFKTQAPPLLVWGGAKANPSSKFSAPHVPSSAIGGTYSVISDFFLTGLSA